VHERRARLRGLDGIEHRSEFLVVDVDRVQRLRRLSPRPRRDGRDWIARVQRAVEREHGLVADLRPVRPVRAHVVGKQHDAAVRHGRRVDPADPRVGVRRAQDPGMQDPRQLDVLRVPDAAPDHAASSSSARRTSTAITRLRYAAEPRTSAIGSIASA
jgi:hypothetical protein